MSISIALAAFLPAAARDVVTVNAVQNSGAVDPAEGTDHTGTWPPRPSMAVSRRSTGRARPSRFPRCVSWGSVEDLA